MDHARLTSTPEPLVMPGPSKTGALLQGLRGLALLLLIVLLPLGGVSYFAASQANANRADTSSTIRANLETIADAARDEHSQDRSLSPARVREMVKTMQWPPGVAGYTVRCGTSRTSWLIEVKPANPYSSKFEDVKRLVSPSRGHPWYWLSSANPYVVDLRCNENTNGAFMDRQIRAEQ